MYFWYPVCSRCTSRCQRGNWEYCGECVFSSIQVEKIQFPPKKKETKQTTPPPKKNSYGEGFSHCWVNDVGGCPGDDVSVGFLDWNVFAQNYYNLNKLWVCIHHPEEKKVCITAVMLKGHSLTLKSSLLIKFCLSSKVSEFCACGFTWNEWMKVI